MSTKMLVDARHPEETRVVIQRDNKIEDFDFEAAAKRQLKGNIYLAKVTRVEPSLQAAFVDYGGNRHGFLAFSEIHPDYYQIPVEDREALLAEEHSNEEIDDEEEDEAAEEAKSTEDEDSEETTTVSGDHSEDEEEIRRSRRNHRRRYKIQEVIKRRQILLVQVVKEERGNKGAALTTYMSLAGRYCVLMPNSTHSGGISRKIASAKDRKRLRTIMSDLQVPKGMGCIIRTAGLERTKTEIKRDYDYLLRLWDGIRERTMESIAPCLIHEEGDLIKRSIRDLYSRDIDQILVEGEGGYKIAKNFMRLLMPSHAKKVQQYKDAVPLFHRYQVEASMETMYSPTVQLKSGGYIVINPTEALVAIDVNSGRSTREHNIEETAVSTNLEAATEIARQLRMRDLAGLIVIDFIDMENRGNVRNVERRMREALKTDRARVQVGRISTFGLLEMSRQRLRPGLFEASSHVCPTCKGAGAVRSIDSCALYALRVLEDEAIKGRGSVLKITLQSDVALYVLNQKRDSLRELEERYGISIAVSSDADIIAPDYVMNHSGPPPKAREVTAVEQEQDEEEKQAAPDAKADEEEKPSKRRRKRRRPRKKQRDDDNATVESKESDASEEDSEAKQQDAQPAEEQSEEKPKKRRRGRRGGRNRRSKDSQEQKTEAVEVAEEQKSESPEKEKKEEAPKSEAAPAEAKTDDNATEAKAEKKPVKRRARRTKKQIEEDKAKVEAEEKAKAEVKEAPVETAEKPEESAEEKPKRRTRRKRTPKAEEAKSEPKVEEAAPQEKADESEIAAQTEEPKKQGPKRRGWWQRATGS
ncbi:MAG: Rne/Rng family ribonuclease [Sphingomonadales bacterium]|jgi:ribonuclease E